jgi:hypothetical protein
VTKKAGTQTDEESVLTLLRGGMIIQTMMIEATAPNEPNEVDVKMKRQVITNSSTTEIEILTTDGGTTRMKAETSDDGPGPHPPPDQGVQALTVATAVVAERAGRTMMMRTAEETNMIVRTVGHTTRAAADGSKRWSSVVILDMRKGKKEKTVTNRNVPTVVTLLHTLMRNQPEKRWVLDHEPPPLDVRVVPQPKASTPKPSHALAPQASTRNQWTLQHPAAVWPSPHPPQHQPGGMHPLPQPGLLPALCLQSWTTWLKSRRIQAESRRPMVHHRRLVRCTDAEKSQRPLLERRQCQLQFGLKMASTG